MKAKEAIEYYRELTSEIDKNINRYKYVYTIHDNEYFKAEISDKLEDMQRIYWEEILQRAHWAGLSSLLRNLQWIKGVSSGIKENNLLSFTANLRCLIESSGDNFFSLLSVPTTLADNSINISNALKGIIENNKIYSSKELEEILIHFSYARKISKEEKELQGKMPKYQNAKPASAYLKKLDHKVDNGKIAELYSILCQFSHPAAHSIHYFFNTEFEDEKYKFSYAENADNKYIEHILSQYNDEIIISLQYGFNPSIITLKTLNFFDYDLTKTEYVNKIQLDNIKAWIDIHNKIKL